LSALTLSVKVKESAGLVMSTLQDTVTNSGFLKKQAMLAVFGALKAV
jgi:hypothetical protein